MNLRQAGAGMPASIADTIASSICGTRITLLARATLIAASSLPTSSCEAPDKPTSANGHRQLVAPASSGA